jgi:DNA polymerase elongation subunit (family B)
MLLRPSEWDKAGGQRRRTKFRQEQRKYVDCDYYAFPEFAVIDTYWLAYKAEQMGIIKPEDYGLHNLARLLGVAHRSEKAEWGEIHTDMEKVKERLRGDLLEAIAVFRAIWKNLHPILHFVPVSIQDLFLKSTGSLVSYILINEALRTGEPIPAPQEKVKYEGARVYATKAGVYHHIINTDVASLYPNIMLQEEGCSRPLAKAKLKQLTDLRLEYKERAKQGDAEADALQNALKILINSFYGFYGTGGLPFNSMKIAANITAKGRELLTKMIERASERGTVILADTDGVAVSLPAPPTPDDHRFFEKLLHQEGYKLETKQYDACIVRAMKNYAHFKFNPETGEWTPVVLKGSSHKSRSRTEAVMELTHLLLTDLLTQQFSVERTVEHIHRLLYEHQKHIVPQKVSEASRERRAHLLTDEDILGSRFYFYFTVGTTKTGKYSYAQKGTVRVSGRGARDEMVAPPNLQKHADDLLNVVRMYADIIGKDAIAEIKQRVKALIPPADEWVRMWERGQDRP